MRYKLLGNSGLRVSELCLGAMTFGTDWGWGADKDTSRQIYEAFRETGGNFIDTANFYTGGTSEKLIGEFISSERDRVVLATKYSSSMDDDNPNASGNSRKNMMQSVEASLKRLGTDYIDLYWVHTWDFMTPIEEVMRGLDDLVRQGKVLYVGISDTPAWIVSQAQMLAELRGWSPFVGLQIEYNLVERTIEREFLPMARSLDLGVLAWSPLGGGILTGKYNRENGQAGSNNSESTRQDAMKLHQMNSRSLAIADEVQEIAREIDRQPAQIALNWVRQKGAIPIVGATKLSHIKNNLGCLEFDLSADQMTRLDEVTEIEMGFPYDFYPYVRQAMYGNILSQIDHHRANRSGFPITLSRVKNEATAKAWSR
ncbi:MAG: aldo/keto reductase [Tolypothrix carrinoi HA7290-LM1]|jgi:aryl-alcohol dehydrogenase-like predicted oxidoreductase|nr:aldo/keto reductase [Tolypothrix carrinoi HA7290-LM1]